MCIRDRDKSEIAILGPVVRSKKGEFRGTLEEIQRGGFVRVRIDGIIYRIEEALGKSLDRNKKHNIEVVVDKLVIGKELDKYRLADSLEIGLRIGKGIVIINCKPYTINNKQEKKRSKVYSLKSKVEDVVFSEHFACEECGISLPELEPRFFSFNSPYGACSECMGLGEKLEVDPKLVIPNQNLTIAEGAIRPWMRACLADSRRACLADSRRASHKIGRQNHFWGQLNDLAEKYNFSLYVPIKELPKEIINLILYGESAKSESNPSGSPLRVQRNSKFEIRNSSFEGVIPNLERKYHGTDSEWTRQEIEQYMVATQIGSKLTGVLYILDEPSIGLHHRDQGRLIETLKKLRDLGNTVVIVEHDNQTIRAANFVIDIGPGAGKHGGRIVFEGTPKQLLKSKTLTGDYMAGRRKVELKCVTSGFTHYLVIKGAQEHNLKNIDIKIPLGKFVCITGVSGSGKSSLMNDILARALLKKFYSAKKEPGEHKGILGAEFLNKVVLVDQSPIGRTPRSNPATYTGAFSYIRDLFSRTREARVRGYLPGRFSFNVKGGRCETCEGQGQIKVEMYFLPDVYVECKECKGKRYNKEALEIEYKGKNIAEVLETTIEEAMEFFKNIPGLYQKLKTLNEVGLSYIQLGQPAPSLSGGEAQRVKLATELSRKATGKTLYILDEPTTGLHPDDIKKLVKVLRELVNKGNTVLIIEHNLDVVKCTDWVIDLGPEGGDEGGYIVAEGTPKDISKNKKSYTGQYLKI